jgi:hypothetical protein
MWHENPVQNVAPRLKRKENKVENVGSKGGRRNKDTRSGIVPKLQT